MSMYIMCYVPTIDEYKIQGILVIIDRYIIYYRMQYLYTYKNRFLDVSYNKNNTNSFIIKYKMNEKLRNIICVRYLY